MTTEGDNERIERLYRYAAQLDAQVRSGRVTRESLGRSQMDQWAVTKALELIGEEAWLLSKEGCDLGPEVPLQEMGLMRHHLVHHYDGVDWNIAEEVTFEDVPQLVKSLRPVLEERGIEVYEPRDEG